MKKLKHVDASCVLVALWYVTGIDESAVLRICTAHGFREGQGMADEEWKKAAVNLGISMRAVSMEECTLKQFIKKYHDGLFLVGTFDHLFVVDNGIIVDPRCSRPPGLGRKIKQAWKVLVDESKKSG